MATSNTDGSQTATGGEDTLATITTSGTFVLGLDTNAMLAGDTIVIKVKLKVRSVGTTRIVYEQLFTQEALNEPVILTIPVASTNEIVFTIEQTTGTNRAYPFEIWEL